MSSTSKKPTMQSTALLQRCWPILQDAALDDDDRADKLQELIQTEEPTLSAKEVEEKVLDVLWLHRRKTNEKTTIENIPQERLSRIAPGMKIKPLPKNLYPQSSPRQGHSIPVSVGVSPSSNDFLVGSRPTTASDTSFSFSRSLRSPHLPFGNPEGVDELGRRLENWNVDDGEEENEMWPQVGLVSPEGLMSAESYFQSENGLSEQHGDYTAMLARAVSPHDIIRVFFGIPNEQGGGVSDSDLEKALEDNSWDIKSTVTQVTQDLASGEESKTDERRTITVGKSMATARPFIPLGKRPQTLGLQPVVCRYWLEYGKCARADCKYSHDPSNTICKYWFLGHCASGDDCPFMHDPRTSPEWGGAPTARRPRTARQSTSPMIMPVTTYGPYDATFPALVVDAAGSPSLSYVELPQSTGSDKKRLNPLANFTPSRPTSQNTSRTGTPVPLGPSGRAITPTVDVSDSEAFPALGAGSRPASGKHQKKGHHHGHHGKRSHGHSHGHGSGSGDAAATGERGEMNSSPVQTSERGRRRPRSRFASGYVGQRGGRARAEAVNPEDS